MLFAKSDLIVVKNIEYISYLHFIIYLASLYNTMIWVAGMLYIFYQLQLSEYAMFLQYFYGVYIKITIIPNYNEKGILSEYKSL